MKSRRREINSNMSGAMSGYAARFFDIKRPGSGPGATRERAYPSAICRQWEGCVLRPTIDKVPPFTITLKYRSVEI
jgi:hypothetical protein